MQIKQDCFCSFSETWPQITRLYETDRQTDGDRERQFKLPAVSLYHGQHHVPVPWLSDFTERFTGPIFGRKSLQSDTAEQRFVNKQLNM